MIKAKTSLTASLLIVLFTASVSCNANSTTVSVLPSSGLSPVQNQASTTLTSVVGESSSTSSLSAGQTISNTSLMTSLSQTDVMLSTVSVGAPSNTATSIQNSTIQLLLGTLPATSSPSTEIANSSTISSNITLSKTQGSVLTSQSIFSSHVLQSSSIVNGTINESSVAGHFMTSSSSTPSANYTTTALPTTSGYTSKTLYSASSIVANVSSYITYPTGNADSTTTTTTTTTSSTTTSTTSTTPASADQISYSSPLSLATEVTSPYVTANGSLDSSRSTMYLASPTTTSMSMENSVAMSTPQLSESSTLTSETSSIGQRLTSSSHANKMTDHSITATAITTASHWLPQSSSAHIVMTPSPVIRDEFLIFRITSLLVNSTFTESLNNRTAKSYLNLATSVKNKLHVILNESEFYKDVQIVGISNYSNSIQVVAVTYYNFTITVTADSLNASIQTKSNSFNVISIKELCSNVSCSNGGSCQEATKDIICSCKIGFSGARCLSTYPVDGNYTSWSSYQSCSKSCGKGVKIRTRTCSSPPPMHGGRNCSSLGNASETMPCNEHNCPDIDWVIWIIVGAGSFVLLLVVILACCFQKRKKYYYRDYGLTEDGRSYSLSRAAYANKLYEGNLSEFRAQENIVPLEVLKEDPFKNSYINQQYESDEANHNGNTVYERELKTFLGNTSKIRAKKPDDTGEYLEPEQTFHPPKNPEEIVTAQVVYENTPERML